MISFGKFVSAVSLMAVAAWAQSAEEIAAYPDYAELFEAQQLTWETVKVQTERGFILTAFHITGSTENGPYEITKPTMVMLHGLGGSAASYLRNWLHPSKDMTLKQLAEQGFDVWMQNNSAVKYSDENIYYTPYDKEYWQIDWITYGTDDFPALVDVIKERTGVDKVAILGHSQGTTQTFAGMALMPEWYDENVSVAAFWGPCTIPNQKYFKDLYTAENWNFLYENEIWATGGPDWDRAYKVIMESGPQYLKEQADYYGSLPATPMQAVASYAQASASQRFQKYDPDWFNYIEENGSYPKTELLDYGMVKKMQVGMYIGLFDDSCPMIYTFESIQQMGPGTVTHTMVAPWQGHVPWNMADSEWYTNDLAEFLQRNQD